MTPIKAIRAKCIECCCGNAAEVKRCPILDCSLHDFRMGHNPNINRQPMTEEMKNACADRLRSARAQSISKTEAST